MTPPSLPLLRSLRLRLPLFISAVVVVVLGTFLWTTNRTLEQTLLRAARDRARAAAGQVAALMVQSTAPGTAEIRRAAASDAVRRYLLQPSAGTAVEARRALLPLTMPAQPPVEVWDAGGTRVLEVASPSGGAPVLTSVPPGSARRGIGAFRVDHGLVVYDAVADVHGTASAASADAPAARLLGSVVYRRTVASAQTKDAVGRLVGNGGLVEIGNRGGSAWTDFSSVHAAPAIDTTRNGVAEYRDGNGEQQLGALSVVASTPWAVWIEFPRQAVLGPARALLPRMLGLAAAFVLFSAALVAVVISRIMAPLYDLTTASEAIAAGQFANRVSADRSDEIGRLGRSFNTMTERVAEAQRTLEARVEARTVGLREAVEELEAFAYSVSHDLRAPLRHVVGFAALLEESSSAALTPEARRHLRIVVDAANRMGRLIDDLLAFSRVGRTPVAKRAVDLNQLVRDAQHEVMAADGSCRVAWRLGDLPTVEGDAALLRLVLVNLLSNAVKYSARRELPEIDVGVVPGHANEAVVFVRDNGEGFDMQYAHKLFGVFQRLHRHEEFEGTGIGLANVRRIIHRHGGRTWAEGVVMGGATFYFSLPVTGTEGGADGGN